MRISGATILTFFLIAFAAGYALFPVMPVKRACAAGAAVNTPCDPQYMDALEARAYLEAQREIAQNQNIIVKPDSVLEYSCFVNFLYDLANANPIFSEDGCCDAPDGGLGDDSLDNAFAQVIGTSVTNYLFAFSHTALGGRDLNNTLKRPDTKTVGDFTHDCYRMDEVWKFAKCKNFLEPDTFANDGFYDFKWYSTNDPRKWPTACPAPAIPPSYLDVAFNQETDRYTGAENPWPPDGTPYVKDPVTTYFELILPVGHALAPNCGDPILTGVCVKRNAMNAYADAVCPNPGCHYVSTAGSGNSPCGANPPVGKCQQ